MVSVPVRYLVLCVLVVPGCLAASSTIWTDVDGSSLTGSCRPEPSVASGQQGTLVVYEDVIHVRDTSNPAASVTAYSLSDLFGTLHANTFHSPRAVYDRYANEYVVVACNGDNDSSTSHLHVAVTRSGYPSPISSSVRWYTWDFAIDSGEQARNPSVAASGSYLTLMYDVMTQPGLTYLRTEVRVIPSYDTVSTPTGSTIIDNSTLPVGSMLAANDAYQFSSAEQFAFRFTDTGPATIASYRIDPAAGTVTSSYVPIVVTGYDGNHDTQLSVPQAGTATQLSVGDGRIVSAARGGSQYVFLARTYLTSSYHGIAWYQMDVSGAGAPVLDTQGTYWSSGVHRSSPVIGGTANTMWILFTESSASAHASVRWAWRTTDSASTGGPTTLRSSSTEYTASCGVTGSAAAQIGVVSSLGVDFNTNERFYASVVYPGTASTLYSLGYTACPGCPDCPNDCSGRGTCNDNGSCTCDTGLGANSDCSPDCSTSPCDNPYYCHLDDVCCAPLFTGSACDSGPQKLVPGDAATAGTVSSGEELNYVVDYPPSQDLRVTVSITTGNGDVYGRINEPPSTTVYSDASATADAEEIFVISATDYTSITDYYYIMLHGNGGASDYTISVAYVDPVDKPDPKNNDPVIPRIAYVLGGVGLLAVFLAVIGLRNGGIDRGITKEYDPSPSAKVRGGAHRAGPQGRGGGHAPPSVSMASNSPSQRPPAAAVAPDDGAAQTLGISLPNMYAPLPPPREDPKAEERKRAEAKKREAAEAKRRAKEAKEAERRAAAEAKERARQAAAMDKEAFARQTVVFDPPVEGAVDMAPAPAQLHLPADLAPAAAAAAPAPAPPGRSAKEMLAAALPPPVSPKAKEKSMKEQKRLERERVAAEKKAEAQRKKEEREAATGDNLLKNVPKVEKKAVPAPPAKKDVDLVLSGKHKGVGASEKSAAGAAASSPRKRASGQSGGSKGSRRGGSGAGLAGGSKGKRSVASDADTRDGSKGSRRGGKTKGSVVRGKSNGSPVRGKSNGSPVRGKRQDSKGAIGSGKRKAGTAGASGGSRTAKAKPATTSGGSRKGRKKSGAASGGSRKGRKKSGASDASDAGSTGSRDALPSSTPVVKGKKTGPVVSSKAAKPGLFGPGPSAGTSFKHSGYSRQDID